MAVFTLLLNNVYVLVIFMVNLDEKHGKEWIKNEVENDRFNMSSKYFTVFSIISHLTCENITLRFPGIFSAKASAYSCSAGW